MKTTKKHFELFVKECKYWINKLGLQGWQIVFFHEEIENKNRADISWSITARNATINLEPNWQKNPITDEIIKRTAFHEVCELFIARLAMMADGKMSNAHDSTEEEVHAIIRTLENTMFEDSLK